MRRSQRHHEYGNLSAWLRLLAELCRDDQPHQRDDVLLAAQKYMNPKAYALAVAGPEIE